MARIAGIDIPRGKQVWVALQYLHGIGPNNVHQVLAKARVNPQTKVENLSEAEIARLREVIDREHIVEGELRRQVSQNIRRLMEIGSYRGLRHRRNLPVKGQRTRTNARTKRGPRKTVAGRGRRRGAGRK